MSSRVRVVSKFPEERLKSLKRVRLWGNKDTGELFKSCHAKWPHGGLEIREITARLSQPNVNWTHSAEVRRKEMKGTEQNLRSFSAWDWDGSKLWSLLLTKAESSPCPYCVPDSAQGPLTYMKSFHTSNNPGR